MTMPKMSSKTTTTREVTVGDEKITLNDNGAVLSLAHYSKGRFEGEIYFTNRHAIAAFGQIVHDWVEAALREAKASLPPPTTSSTAKAPTADEIKKTIEDLRASCPSLYSFFDMPLSGTIWNPCKPPSPENNSKDKSS